MERDSGTLIKPIIKRKPGECFKCGFPLGVIQREMIDIILNNEGLPIKYETTSYKNTGYCANCGAIYPNMTRRGIYFDTKGGLFDFINS